MVHNSLYGAGVSAADARAAAPAQAHNHFGLLIVSCERGDLRPTPTGVLVDTDGGRSLEALPAPDVPRAEVIEERAAAALDGVPPLHTGRWGTATAEVCLTMLRSSRERREVPLHHQVGLADVRHRDNAPCR